MKRRLSGMAVCSGPRTHSGPLTGAAVVLRKPRSQPASGDVTAHVSLISAGPLTENSS